MSLSNDQRAELKQRLLGLQSELQAGMAQREAAAAPVELDQTVQGRLSRVDALQGQAMAQAAVRRAQAQLLNIARALDRIDADDFGRCADCDELIAYARLQRDPTHQRCVACAQARE